MAGRRKEPKTNGSRQCPLLIARISNRALPPLIFLSISVLAFYLSGHLPDPVSIDLKLTGLFSVGTAVGVMVS